MQRFFRTLLLVLLILSAFLVVRGYRFTLLDQYEHLPLLYRTLDPGYLQNDWFTNEMDRLNPRTYFVSVVAGVTWLIGDAGAHFVLYAVVFGALSLGVIRLGSCLLGSRTAAVFGLVLMLLAPRNPMGAKDFIVHYLRHNMLATAGVVWALAMLFEKRWRLAWLLCGLATVFHMRTGVLGAMLLGILTLMHIREIKPKELAVSAVAFLIPALAAGIPLLITLRSQGAGLSDTEFIEILGRFRAPWHHMPSRFSLAVYYRTGLLFMTAAAVFHVQPPSPYRREVYALVGTLIALCAGAYIFVEAIPIALVMSLNLIRATVLFHLLAMIFLGGAVCWGIREGRLEDALPAAALALCIVTHADPFAAALLSVLWVIARGSRELRPVVATISGVVVAAVLLLALLVVVKPGWGGAAVRAIRGDYIRFGLASLLACGALGLYALWMHGGVRWQARMRRLAPVLWLVPVLLVLFKVFEDPLSRRFPGIHDLTVARMRLQTVYKGDIDVTIGGDIDAMAVWCRDCLPEDAIVLAPPQHIGFRVKAARAIVVDFKAIPFTRDGLGQWHERMGDLLGGARFRGGFLWYHDLRRAYAALTADDFRRLADKYGASHILVQKPAELPFPLLHESDSFRLYAAPGDLAPGVAELEPEGLIAQ